jgi:hypothetical protein
MLKIPDNKELIIWFPVCKSGTQTFINLLNKKNIKIIDGHKYKPNMNMKNSIIRAPSVSDLVNLKKFKHLKNIDSYYMITNSRNPYKRAFSGWRFHRYFKNSHSFLHALKNPPKDVKEPLNTKLKKDQQSGYRHFTKSISDRVILNGELKHQFTIRLEFIDEDINKLFKLLNLGNINEIPHVNKTLNKKPNRDLTIKEEIEIEKLFYDDFVNFNYELKHGKDKW